MTEMVERVARAIYESKPDADRRMKWDRLLAWEKALLCTEARAAIAAMRDVSDKEFEKMKAAASEHGPMYGNHWSDNLHGMYTAMIGAALDTPAAG